MTTDIFSKVFIEDKCKKLIDSFVELGYVSDITRKEFDSLFQLIYEAGYNEGWDDGDF